MANGTAKRIAEVVPGDAVQSYDVATKIATVSTVTKLNNHPAGGYPLVGVWLSPAHELTADTRPQTAPVLLEATTNHPVLTATGKKALGDVNAGELLYRIETGQAVPYRVIRTDSSLRTVERVYSLSTGSGAYVVGGTVVLDK